MDLKTNPKEGRCFAARCRSKASTVHHVDGAALALCEQHALQAVEEYGDHRITEIKAAPSKEPQVITPELAQELTAEKQEQESALAEIKDFDIVDAEDVAFVEEEKAKVKEVWASFEAKRTSVTKPLNEALRGINGWFKPVQQTLKEVEKAWNQKLSAYAMRKAQEQRALVEAARSAEKPEEIREALVAAADSVPEVTRTTFIERYVFEVFDDALVPREFLTPDLDKIGKVVAALKDKTDIPGVRAWNDPIVKQNARK